MDVIVFESAQHIQVRLQGVFNDDLRIITMARVTVIVAVVIGQGNEEIIDLIQPALHYLSRMQGDGDRFPGDLCQFPSSLS